MIPLHAPDFMKKLKLLVEHAGYKNLAQIASEMGVKEPTLRSWAKAHTGRLEGMISRKGREPVSRFYCAHLPHLSEQAVTDLLGGPYDDLAIAFLLRNMSSLSRVIERNASFEGVKLYVDLDEASEMARKSAQLREQKIAESTPTSAETELRNRGIVTIKTGPKIDPKEFVPMGVDFRLEFPLARRAKYYLGFQQTSQAWAVVAAAPSEEEQLIYMPAPDEGGKLLMMSETHDRGASRFTLIQAMQPFPEGIYACLRDGIPLNRTDIGLLARHLQELPKADRTLHAIDIGFI